MCLAQDPGHVGIPRDIDQSADPKRAVADPDDRAAGGHGVYLAPDVDAVGDGDIPTEEGDHFAEDGILGEDDDAVDNEEGHQGHRRAEDQAHKGPDRGGL